MSWEGTRLHIVTGKGGTGKTTVAGALALTLAAEGKNVLIAEVEGRQGISQLFDVPPLGEHEVRVARSAAGGSVWGLSVDAKAALLEYLQMFYKLGRAGGLLERFGVIDFATTIAPGVRDVLLIGKIYEVAGRRPGRRSSKGERYDAIVLDAPPTGRIGRFLNVNSEVAGLAKMGPIKNQADSITTMLTSATTAVHLVTLLEEMPVQETLDAVAELREIGLPIGNLVINQEQADLLSDTATEMLTADHTDWSALAGDLSTAGLRVGPTLVDGLTQAGRDLADRLTLQDGQRDDLAALQRPTYHLPMLSSGVEDGGLRQLADLLMVAAP